MSSSAVLPWSKPKMNALAKLRSNRASFTTLQRSRSIKPQWPNPSASIGRFIAKIGAHSCWEAKGPARSIFQTLGQEIKKYLDAYSEPLTNWVTWSIYMVGSCPERAVPTIIFCCESEPQRKRIRDTVRDSGIVDGYPGIALKHLARAPDYNQLVQLASNGGWDDTLGSQASRPSTGQPLILCNSVPIVPGAQLIINLGEHALARKSTVGGILKIGNSHYIMTAAHVFLDAPAAPVIDSHQEELYFTDSEDEFEITFDNEYNIRDSTFGHEKDSESSRSSRSASLSDPVDVHGLRADEDEFQADENEFQAAFTDESDDLSYKSMHEASIGVGQLCLSSHDGPRPELDYALIELRHGSSQDLAGTFGTQLFSRDLVKAMEGKYTECTGVMAVTASGGSITGHLCSTTTFIRPPHIQHYQEVCAARFEGSLSEGDCGSWVIDLQSGTLCGHIVAGSPGAGFAYIVPAAQVLKDIEERMGHVPVPCLGTEDGRVGAGFDDNQEALCLSADKEVKSKNSTVLERSQMPPYSGNSKVFQQQEQELGQGSTAESQNSASKPILAQDLTARFQKFLGEKRKASLRGLRASSRLYKNSPNDSFSAEDERPPSYSSLSKLPLVPSEPLTSRSRRFFNMLRSFTEFPSRWEDTGLLDEALRVVPLEQIYGEAEEESQILEAEAKKLGASKAAWGYQDCVARALLRWFKRSFFHWVNNPVCTACHQPTISRGMATPLPHEQALGAGQVELYECSSAECSQWERFPRLRNAFALLQTRRGRAGEWANCFGMLCRAIGSRVRWVWNAEDHVWIEVYSQHRRRWVHMDPCEEAWDTPRMYTEGWGKSLSYCIAFSPDGVVDVTRRYVRSARYALPRTRVSEEELLYMMENLTSKCRAQLSDEDKARLKKEDSQESEELAHYIAMRIAFDICKLQLVDIGEGKVELREAADSTSGPKSATPRPRRGIADLPSYTR